MKAIRNILNLIYKLLVPLFVRWWFVRFLCAEAQQTKIKYDIKYCVKQTHSPPVEGWRRLHRFRRTRPGKQHYTVNKCPIIHNTFILDKYQRVMFFTRLMTTTPKKKHLGHLQVERNTSLTFVSFRLASL